MGEILDVGDEGPRLGRRRLAFIERFGDDGEKTRLVGKIADPDAADTLQDDLHVSGRLAFGRDNGDERADVMEILGSGIVSIRITVSGHDQPAVGSQGVVDGAYRSRAPD